MNAKQREIIVNYFEDYIRNGMRCDPVGGFSDFAYFFKEIRETDDKLDSEMKEIYDEIPEY
ncbi:hypothetical protein FACS189426_06360 [Bacteroidia bacterium]|nr:hypothetical protein FACS189426_06360 [Bacteroidia bacterium]GHV71204.1 hypothetical protein FACS189420_5410 [Bacteroidia bacterium]